MKFEPIGFIRSSVTEAIDHCWGEVESDIHLNDYLTGGLKKLGQFSHVIIIFYMHKTPTFNLKTDLIRRPQGRLDMPKIGIFAQRAKHRPNPIGITVVQIISVMKNILRVKGLDAIDGTPVLDIKPYFPVFDRINTAKTPKWVDELMLDYF
ncbi:MAG: tRNA (N6-threonylcarbamoyladenosine(37)-N6)-methyltransferase TrmO [Candidatus Heimdallarchaeota archaeon]|nr:MAG: tRNA (N6-threonylcarbamoyladenosine(37)-N6)-methyltransferase TrmO [Candidatus Heimdallarchaeota archaeon]